MSGVAIQSHPVRTMKKRTCSIGAEAGDDDEDDDDDDPMLLEPQTEMTVEGEDGDDTDGDDDDDEDSTGDEIALPPSVTLQPAGAPPLLQRARLELPPSVSITRNPRRVTTTITPATGKIIDRTNREELDRLTREFLDVQGDYSGGKEKANGLAEKSSGVILQCKSKTICRKL